jgi:endonuclease I
VLWHEEDPVDPFEVLRTQRIAELPGWKRKSIYPGLFFSQTGILSQPGGMHYGRQ